MTLRAATAADVAAVADLEQELFGSDAWSAAQVEDELLGWRRRAWVAGDPVHGYAVTAVSGDVVDLERIGVAPGHRRGGVARDLLERAVEAAVGDGAVRMLLEVAADNEGALAFYAGSGFHEISRRRRYYRSGSDAVVLERTLT